MGLKLDKYIKSVEKSLFEDIENDFNPRGLESFEIYSNRMKAKFESQLKEFREHVNDGYEVLMKKLQELEEKNELPRDIADYQLTKEQMDLLEDRRQLEKLEKQKTQVYELFGFSEEIMEEFYQAAVDLYKNKLYEESRNAFVCLTFLNPENSVFWTGLGSSLSILREDERALEAFQFAILYDPVSIEHYVNAVGCCLALNNKEEALNILKVAMDIVDSEEDEETLESLKDDVAALTETIESIGGG